VTHHRQVGEVLWAVHSRDEVMGMAERAVVDFQRGIRRWTSKGDQRNECCEVVEER